MYCNNVFLVGNLTRDVELKALPSGNMVANFGMATNRYYKDKEGNRQDEVEYHNLVAFGKQAELIAQYLKKGSQALIQGRLQTRSWETDGHKNYRTEIIVEAVQFGAKRNDTEAPNQTPAEQPEGKYMHTTDYPEEDISPESIPF